jgi:hypothetical protein
MSDDALDRLLSAEQGIVPSANFARNVMAKVRMEAAAPPPMPFPWKRALPGLVLCVLSLAAMCVAALLRPESQPLREASGPSFWTTTWTSIWTGLSSDLILVLRAANAGGLGWIILALLLTFASVALSLRLIGRRV